SEEEVTTKSKNDMPPQDKKSLH
ncbi:hypothetical protein Tco_1201517, partial [Tanacetum coccineum]